jgi:hypothetical protein
VVDGFGFSRYEGIIDILDEEAFLGVMKVPEEAGFSGALGHANVF